MEKCVCDSREYFTKVSYSVLKRAHISTLSTDLVSD